MDSLLLLCHVGSTATPPPCFMFNFFFFIYFPYFYFSEFWLSICTVQISTLQYARRHRFLAISLQEDAQSNLLFICFSFLCLLIIKFGYPFRIPQRPSVSSIKKSTIHLNHEMTPIFPFSPHTKKNTFI